MGLVLSSLASTLLWNIERTIFGRVATASWDSLLTATTSVANVMATAGFLWATYRLLKETERSNSLTRDLTLQLHSDSLTPFITFEKIEHDLHLTSQSNPTLVVREVSLAEGSKVLINNEVTMDLCELRLSGDIAVSVGNYASSAAEITVDLLVEGHSYSSKAFVGSKDTIEKHFPVAVDLTEADQVRQILSSEGCLAVQVRARGPGASADEIIATRVKLNPRTRSEDSAVLIPGTDMDTERSRIYSRVIG